jgi:hypothetical protein
MNLDSTSLCCCCPSQVHEGAGCERALWHRPLHLELGHVAHSTRVPQAIPAGPQPGAVTGIMHCWLCQYVILSAGIGVVECPSS